MFLLKQKQHFDFNDEIIRRNIYSQQQGGLIIPERKPDSNTLFK